MNLSNSIINFRRHLKRRNCSANTLRSYLNDLKQFVVWVDQPIEQVTHQKIGDYIDHLLRKKLAPKTINCHLVTIRRFYDFLRDEEELAIDNPVRKGRQLRLSKPLPKHLKDGEVMRFLSVIDNKRDLAIFMLMLRSGLRIGEVLDLKVADIQMADRKLLIYEGEKNHIGRVVCLSPDAYEALQQWLFIREPAIEIVFYSRRRRPMAYTTARELFIGYLKKAGLYHKRYTLHSLRHTFATELLNAGMRLECLQQLLGHSSLEMTLRYARLSDKTREEEYFKAMAIIEGEKIHEPEQLDHQLPAPFKAQELFSQHP